MKSALSIHRFSFLFCILITAFLSSTAVQAEDPPGFDPERHIRYSEVEYGMKGYGMTVFNGTTIEPFAVEVVSVERGFEAGKAVVWVRSPDKRMQLTGPVKGMSGSPIYLWEKGKEGKIGEGGRMLGAFAFGYAAGKDCYVGIQPIEQMLEAAARRRPPNPDRAERSSGFTAQQTVRASQAVVKQFNLPAHESWRIEAYANLLGMKSLPNNELIQSDQQDAQPAPNSVFKSNPAPYRMMLPVSVGSSDAAAALKPYFKPFGMEPIATAGNVSTSKPPKWINPDEVKLVPGSVFSLPFITGARDLGAIGTTTEVLKDGTVLAFGHAMNGQGPIVLPMSTGYVHFIQPSLNSSFKIGNSLKIQGTLVHDEESAVIGTSAKAYKKFPMVVKLHYPEAGIAVDYEYEVVHFRPMLPSLIGAAVSGSLTANHSPPTLSTLEYQATIHFSNDKTLILKDLITSGNPASIVSQLATPVGLVVDNQFGLDEVKKVEVKAYIREQREVARIFEINLRNDEYAPGETVKVDLSLMPYRKAPIRRTVSFKLPDDMPEGTHTLSISDARSFSRLKTQAMPHLTLARNEKELWAAVQEISSLKSDALYVSLPINRIAGLALGRDELPELPSSRTAIVADNRSSRATPYAEFYSKSIALPYVPTGSVSIRINVKNK